jgi:hypothetical protein
MVHSPNGTFAKWFIRQMVHMPNGTFAKWHTPRFFNLHLAMRLPKYLFPQWWTEKSSCNIFPMCEIYFSDHARTNFSAEFTRIQFCSTESQITCFFSFLTTIWKKFATALFHALCPLIFRATVVLKTVLCHIFDGISLNKPPKFTQKKILGVKIGQKKIGRKSLVEKVLPYQTFLRDGIPTQWPNQFFVYSFSLF